ncbi:MAG: YbbR-like domain-containing protein [Tannerellaceae bacterium]|jgi:hypothetical protein|nr:YbbR-like domain-containing protein [Tannerellaceae bacterium]
MKRLENIQQSFKSLQRKIKVFLHSYQWKEVLIFLLFIFLSFGFWVLQSLQEEYEIQVSVPVRYRNIPKDMAFVRTPPSEIKVRVRDKGSVLLNYSLGKKISAINLSMKDFPVEKGEIFLERSDIESAIMGKLIATTSLISFNPEQIQEPYRKLIKKRLPVVFDGDIRTEPGFLVSGDVIIDPPFVDVFATDVALDSLTVIKTVFTEIKKGNKAIERDVYLRKINGVVIEPDVVSIYVAIEEYTEKSVEIALRGMNVPPGYTIRMFPSTVRITSTVPLSRFKDLDEGDFIAEVFLSNLGQNVSGMLPVMLSKKPDWIEKVSIQPDSIEFILEQNVSDD